MHFNGLNDRKLKNLSKFYAINEKYLSLHHQFAGVAKLVDALDLGSSAARRGGSSPFIRTRLTAFAQFFRVGKGGF